LEPEGGKRLQNIKQINEKRQNSDFWDLRLDPEAPAEEAVQYGKVSPDEEPEGGKRLQHMEQRTGERQNADF